MAQTQAQGRIIPITREDGTVIQVQIDPSVPEDQIPAAIQLFLEQTGELKLPGSIAKPGPPAKPPLPPGLGMGGPSLPPGLGIGRPSPEAPGGPGPLGTQAPATILNQILPTAKQFATPFYEAGAGALGALGTVLTTPLTDLPRTIASGIASIPQGMAEQSMAGAERAIRGGLISGPGGMPIFNPFDDKSEQAMGLLQSTPLLGPIVSSVEEAYNESGGLPAIGRAGGEGVLAALLGRFLQRTPAMAKAVKTRVGSMLPSRPPAPPPPSRPLGLTQPTPPPQIPSGINPSPTPPGSYFPSPSLGIPSTINRGVISPAIPPKPLPAPPKPRPPDPQTRMAQTMERMEKQMTNAQSQSIAAEKRLAAEQRRAADRIVTAIEGVSESQLNAPVLGFGRGFMSIGVKLGHVLARIPLNRITLPHFRRLKDLTKGGRAVTDEGLAISNFLLSQAESGNPNSSKVTRTQPGAPNPNPGPAVAPRRY